MNTLSKLSFLLFAVALTACNEKVSPELQGAAATSSTTGGSSGGPVTPDQYYFRVVNKSDTMLNFKLHKTGQGNAAKNCEITAPTALSSNGYRADPATYDISCFYEAEELALSFNGLSFAMEASPNTCEYVGYSPFSFYNMSAGSSSQNITKVICNDVTNAQANAALGTTQNCDTHRSNTKTVDLILEAENNFCKFDWSQVDDKYPNCDEGILNITDKTLSRIDTNNDGTPDTTKIDTAVRKVQCGGKAYNCIDGAIKLVPKLAKRTSGIDVSPGSSTLAYSQTYVLTDVFEEYYSNRRYVNYRRDLASIEIEYGNSDRNFNDGDPNNDTTLTSSYLSAWGDPLFKDVFNPELMANYSDNKRMNGAPLVTLAMQTAASDTLTGNASVSTPYTADPFLGIGAYKTNAFYTFYCFDNAFDVKARIRMVVRDWDRVHSSSPSDTSFERISDVDLLPPFARQDVPYTAEVTGDSDSWNEFNDRLDWDDSIDMERDDAGVGYNPAITIWRPYPRAGYLDGFFNPNLFPTEFPPE